MSQVYEPLFSCKKCSVSILDPQQEMLPSLAMRSNTLGNVVKSEAGGRLRGGASNFEMTNGKRQKQPLPLLSLSLSLKLALARSRSSVFSITIAAASKIGGKFARGMEMTPLMRQGLIPKSADARWVSVQHHCNSR